MNYYIYTMIIFGTSSQMSKVSAVSSTYTRSNQAMTQWKSLQDLCLSVTKFDQICWCLISPCWLLKEKSNFPNDIFYL